MALLGSVKNLLFKEIDGVVLDLQTGVAGLEVKNDEGEVIVTFVDDGEAYHLESNPIKELAFPMPAYAVRTAIDKVKKGDIVVLNDGTVSFFLATQAKDKITVVTAKSGREVEVSLAKNRLLGSTGILAVANLFHGGGGQPGGLSSLMPFLLLREGKEGGKDNKHLLMYMLMMQQGKDGKEGDGGLGNLLPLLLLGGDKGGTDPLLLMAMMGQGGGGGMGGLLPLLFQEGKEHKDKAPNQARKPA